MRQEIFSFHQNVFWNNKIEHTSQMYNMYDINIYNMYSINIYNIYGINNKSKFLRYNKFGTYELTCCR